MSSDEHDVPKTNVRAQRITTAIMCAAIGVISGWSGGVVAVAVFLVLGAAVGYAAGGIVAKSRDAGVRRRERRQHKS